MFDAVDDTRVRLADGDPDAPGSDYINANHITVLLHFISHFIHIGRVLFQYPGNLPELPNLTTVLVRKRMVNPVEVVATPVTEMLQCDTPC